MTVIQKYELINYFVVCWLFFFFVIDVEFFKLSFPCKNENTLYLYQIPSE